MILIDECIIHILPLFNFDMKDLICQEIVKRRRMCRSVFRICTREGIWRIYKVKKEMADEGDGFQI